MATTAATKRHLRIDDVAISAEPRETILEAALRSGIDFPNSCRVGGCGACKCRLTGGKVKERTETGYLLSARELNDGYILACQSVAETDVVIAVDRAASALPRVNGRIVGREKLTHDITRLTVALDEPLPYRAGQFANLRIGGLEVTRSYSFATAPRSDDHAVFFIRKVEGGQLSSLVNDEDVAGRSVTLEGPSGDFWLRPSDAPMLLVAGGSGLAPILALLEQAIRDGVSRSVTLLFGARSERDLYAQHEIEVLAKAWPGAFRFVPVLSDGSAASSWQGEAGFVHEKIASWIEPGSHAYLCGPPAMIDRVLEGLDRGHVPRELVHFDRFTTTADVAAPRAPDVRPEAGIFDYAKYSLFHVIGLVALAALLAGGRMVTATLLAVLTFYVLGDAVSGDDTTTPRFARPRILTAQLWLALPLLALIVFVAVWSVSPGDPLGFGAWAGHVIGRDLLATRDATSWGHHVSAWVLTGLMIGMIGTIPAHELTHRTWDRRSMFVGRWLLAFSFDTIFAIEHVYGHHRYVSTKEDPATAPRGRNVYVHIVVSTFKGNVSAWAIEKDRLAKRRLGLVSWHNAFLRGHAMSVVLVALAYAMGGWRGALFFVACALWGKALLEIVNYMEHYGMVRDVRTPVQPRHSWNTNRRISSWSMFNLTRHSHHHAQGEVAYQDLKPYQDAPMMIGGYLTTLVVAMIPPLWHARMTPKVLAWDRDFATPDERRLAARANEASGSHLAMS
jgi:NAD(P)H-flavin reductase/ferredoxin